MVKRLAKKDNFIIGVSVSLNGEISDIITSKKKNTRLKGNSIIEFPVNYVVIDIETTGYDPFYDEIIEVAAIRYKENKQADRFVSLVKPEFLIDEFIIKKTGITNEMVSDAPSVENVLPQYVEFIGDDLIVGHNVNFDINFIYDNLLQCSKVTFSNNYIDHLKISRRILPDLENHKLITVAEYFNVDTTGYHRAEKDCIITNECFKCCEEVTIQKYGSIEDFVKLCKRRTHKPKLRANDIISEKQEFDEGHPLFNQVCVFTGALSKMERKDAMLDVVNVGGICGDTVTKKTNYLIVGSFDYSSHVKGNKSTKIKKAEKYTLEGQDIKIISENTFYDLLIE